MSHENKNKSTKADKLNLGGKENDVRMSLEQLAEIDKMAKQVEAERIAEAEAVAKLEAERISLMTFEQRIVEIFATITDADKQAEAIANLEAEAEAEALTKTSSEQTKAFFKGSDSLALTVYENSLANKFTDAKTLFSLARLLKDSKGKLTPMNLASFTRTWNTSLTKLANNKAKNLKEGNKDKIETISYFANVNNYITGREGVTSTKTRFLEIFKTFLNDENKVKDEIKLIVLSPSITSTKGFETSHNNKILIKPASLELLKCWLLFKGWNESEAEAEATNENNS